MQTRGECHGRPCKPKFFWSGDQSDLNEKSKGHDLQGTEHAPKLTSVSFDFDGTIEVGDELSSRVFDQLKKCPNFVCETHNGAQPATNTRQDVYAVTGANPQFCKDITTELMLCALNRVAEDAKQDKLEGGLAYYFNRKANAAKLMEDRRSPATIDAVSLAGIQSQTNPQVLHSAAGPAKLKHSDYEAAPGRVAMLNSGWAKLKADTGDKVFIISKSHGLISAKVWGDYIYELVKENGKLGLTDGAFTREHIIGSPTAQGAEASKDENGASSSTPHSKGGSLTEILTSKGGGIGGAYHVDNSDSYYEEIVIPRGTSSRPVVGGNFVLVDTRTGVTGDVMEKLEELSKKGAKKDEPKAAGSGGAA